MAPDASTSEKTSSVVVRSRWRHGHHALVAAILSCAAVLGYLLLVGSEHAMAAASCLFGLLALDAVVCIGKWRSTRRSTGSRGIGETRSSDEARHRIGIATARRILVALAFGGLLAASLALEARNLALGATVAFLVLTLFGGPAWIAAVGDEEEFSQDPPESTPDAGSRRG
jgi:hypothetical protein